MSATLISLATANPPLRVTQREAHEFISTRFELDDAARDLYRRLLLDGPILGRCLGMDSTRDALESDPDRLHARFLRFARQTAAAAASEALNRAGIRAADIGALLVNTCTGYACPGLSSYLAEDLRLPRAIRTLDIAGMGCGAALPNLEAAAGFLALDGRRPALCISVEICSATLFPGNDPALVVSNAIFGDGAAAAVLGSNAASRSPRAPLRLIAFRSVLDPKQRQHLRYVQEGGRLRNHLSVKVPVIGARLAAQALDAVLEAGGLQRADIRWWAVHAGGTAVLDRVGRGLGLPPDALRYSRDVFREFGNMSSPTVLFVLDRILREGRPAAGEYGILLAFGAGFSAYAALVRFTGAR